MSWLRGASSHDLLPLLFECLRLAGVLRQPGPGIDDPSGELVAAIHRSDGEDALRHYDELLQADPQLYPGVKFLRLARERLLQDILASAAREDEAALAEQLGLPPVAGHSAS